MAMPVKLKATLRGVGWRRFREKLAANLIGAKEMAGSRWLIGSTLPYASHWIEEGWRNDPRYGHIEVRYRVPATWFMRESVAFMFDVRRRRATAGPVGVVFSGTIMAKWAQAIAVNMRSILNQRVYSVPVPTYSGGRAQWQRTHKLYNSIRAYRV